MKLATDAGYWFQAQSEVQNSTDQYFTRFRARAGTSPGSSASRKKTSNARFIVSCPARGCYITHLLPKVSLL